MAKSLTKLWLRGLGRLVTGQVDIARALKPLAPSKPVRAKTVKKAKPAVSLRRKAPARPVVPESRVRPRASAWTRGTWTRSFHSAPPTAGRFVNHLSYALYLPPGAEGGGVPLVVMLHGCKQDADEFAQGTRINLLADRYGFAVLYPEQSKHDHAHRCWRWYDTSAGAGGGEAASIVSLVDATVREHGLDDERVYVAGMSAGAGMASLLAVRYPGVFAAVALHSGVVFGDARSAVGAMDVMRRGSRKDPVMLVDAAVDLAGYPGMPAMIVHGELDSVVSSANAEQLTAEFLRLNGMVDAAGGRRGGETREDKQDGATVRDYVKGGRRVVRTVLVRGLGHAWSGGDDTVPFHSSKGPDVTGMLWEFFKHQRRVRQHSSAASSA
jgi:poly(hydroxyalkanoate) depolymerase family esterase